MNRIVTLLAAVSAAALAATAGEAKTLRWSANTDIATPAPSAATARVTTAV